MRKAGRRIQSIAALFVLLLLAGCGGEMAREVTFYRDEGWEASLIAEMPLELVTMMGSTEEIEHELDVLVDRANARGLDAKWTTRRDETTLIYEVTMEGSGLDLLNEFVFDNSANILVLEEGGNRRISFAMGRGGLFDASSETLTLTGGEILTTNGVLIDDDTVQWVNPSGRMEAELTERGRFGLGTFIAVLIGFGLVGTLLVGGGAGFFFWNQRRQKAGQPLAGPCPICGTELTAEAQFCFNCGNPRNQT